MSSADPGKELEELGTSAGQLQQEPVERLAEAARAVDDWWHEQDEEVQQDPMFIELCDALDAYWIGGAG